MRTLSIVLGIALLFGLLLSGCMYLESGCPDEALPLLGSIEDYSTAAGEYEGVTLHEPVLCEDEELEGGHLIVMEGHGAAFWISRINEEDGCPSADYQHCSVDQDSFEYGLLNALGGAYIDCSGYSFGGLCQAQAEQDCGGCYFYIRDWGKADKAVEIMMEEMALADLGECVSLMVAPEQMWCM